MKENKDDTSQELLGLLPAERIQTKEIHRPVAATVAAYLDLPDMAGLVARAMDRLGINGAIPAYDLTPLITGQRIVGPAITVRNIPTRFAPLYCWQEGLETQLGEREAYYLAQPGDIIVIDSGGRPISSNLGPNSSLMALSQGIIGAIVDGPVTGPAGIRAHGFPVWCRGGTTITGHHRVDTIEINGPVACSSVQVRPGDLVVADDSGISIVPVDFIQVVLRLAQNLARKGQRLSQVIQDGGSIKETRTAFQHLIRDV